MTLLNASYLWFLPLLAIPIIIHLLAKRKSKLIEFPSLKFLRLLEQEALKKFNIKQLLLLILRTLMILLLILAFARPYLNSSGGASLQLSATKLAVILIDNTASTVNLFEDVSSEWVPNLAEELREKGYDVRFADLATLTLAGDRLAITPGYQNASSAEALARFASQIDLDIYTEKMLVWVGDGQDANRVISRLESWDAYVYSYPISKDYGIADVQLPQRGVQAGQNLAMDISIVSALEDDTEQSLELILNEERQNQRVIALGETKLQMIAQIKESGFQLGEFRLGEDRLPYNDTRYFVLPAQGDFPFQILRERKSIDYWRVIASALEQLSVNLDVRLIDLQRVDDLDLGRGGTVLIEDASRLADYSWGRLKGFMERGGQVILFGNGGTQMSDLLGLSSMAEEESLTTSLLLRMTATGRNQLALEPLENVISANRLKVYKRFVSTSMELESTWIRFVDDQPFLGSVSHGQGQLVWFNTEFSTGQTNLPLLGIFPPLMLHLGQSVVNTDMTSQFNYMVGDTVLFQPEASDTRESFGILRPDGTVDYATPDTSFVLTYTNTDLPGHYQLQRGRHIVQSIAVNITRGEAAAHSINYDLKEGVTYQSSDPVEFAREVLENRTAQPIWPLLIFLLLLIWIIETYLSRMKKTWRQHD